MTAENVIWVSTLMAQKRILACSKGILKPTSIAFPSNSFPCMEPEKNSPQPVSRGFDMDNNKARNAHIFISLTINHQTIRSDYPFPESAICSSQIHTLTRVLVLPLIVFCFPNYCLVVLRLRNVDLHPIAIILRISSVHASLVGSNSIERRTWTDILCFDRTAAHGFLGGSFSLLVLC